MNRWPTSLKTLRAKHPDGPLVQMRVTFSQGTDVSYDGAATPAIMRALFDVIVEGTSDPSIRELPDALKREDAE